MVPLHLVLSIYVLFDYLNCKITLFCVNFVLGLEMNHTYTHIHTYLYTFAHRKYDKFDYLSL